MSASLLFSGRAKGCVSLVLSSARKTSYQMTCHHVIVSGLSVSDPVTVSFSVPPTWDWLPRRWVDNELSAVPPTVAIPLPSFIVVAMAGCI